MTQYVLVLVYITPLVCLGVILSFSVHHLGQLEISPSEGVVLAFLRLPLWMLQNGIFWASPDFCGIYNSQNTYELSIKSKKNEKHLELDGASKIPQILPNFSYILARNFGFNSSWNVAKSTLALFFLNLGPVVRRTFTFLDKNDVRMAVQHNPNFVIFFAIFGRPKIKMA